MPTCTLRRPAFAALLAVGLLAGCRERSTQERRPARAESRSRPPGDDAPLPSDASRARSEVFPSRSEGLPPRADTHLPSGDASATGGRPIDVEDLCVSLGALQRPLEGGLWVNRGAQLRATFPASGGNQASISFRYLGRTAREVLLGSGSQRWQLGLKLRAADTCNVVYVMWRFGTPSSVVASVKDNPGQHLHVECENRGYRTLLPLWSLPVREPEPASVHELSARIVADVLEVSIDARQVLRAALDGGSVPERGPSGLRSDNVSFELIRFDADVLAVPASGLRVPCERMFGEEP